MIVEEIMKTVPFQLYLLMFEPQSKALMSFAIGTGAGFSVYENCCYILTEGAESITYIMIRGMAVGVMHIVSIVTFTLGIIIIRSHVKISIAGMLGALALSMTFHGLYNLLVSEPGINTIIGYIMPMLGACLLWIAYRRWNENQIITKKRKNSNENIKK